MPDARIISLADLPADRPMPKIERRRIIGDNMMVSAVHLERGFELDSHSHANEQFVLLLKGRCRFTLGQPGSSSFREVIVSAGQVLVLPGNLPHSCTALEDTDILDLFSPPSEKTGVDRS